VLLAHLSHVLLDLRALLKFLLLDVCQRVAWLSLPLGEEFFHRVCGLSFQDRVSADSLRDLALDARRAALGVDVNHHSVSVDLDRRKRRVVPVLVQAIALSWSTRTSRL